MNEIEFKALMHCGQYVDASLLAKGIYCCQKPFLYLHTETIETLIEIGNLMKDITGKSFISEAYFNNLKECELVSVLITPEESKLAEKEEEWIPVMQKFIHSAYVGCTKDELWAIVKEAEDLINPN